MTILKKIIVQPYGLILWWDQPVPGKPPPLHSALGNINQPEIKIWTAEDPVEITQPGLRQVEAKPRIGLDFARIMRGFLRLDPDVIMIGEMRDEETASIGVEASLTGHLGLFHPAHQQRTGNRHAPAGYGIEPAELFRCLSRGPRPAAASGGGLCKGCRESFHPSQEVFDDIAEDTAGSINWRPQVFNTVRI